MERIDAYIFREYEEYDFIPTDPLLRYRASSNPASNDSDNGERDFHQRACPRLDYCLLDNWISEGKKKESCFVTSTDSVVLILHHGHCQVTNMTSLNTEFRRDA